MMTRAHHLSAAPGSCTGPLISLSQVEEHKGVEMTTRQGWKPSVEYVMSRDTGQRVFVDMNARVFVAMRA